MSSPAGFRPTSRPARTRPTRTQAGPGWVIGSGQERSPPFSKYRPFEQARSFARARGLRSAKESQGVHIPIRPLSADIPAKPDNTYKDAGWASFGAIGSGPGPLAYFLRQYRPFEEARAFARSQGLRSQKEWSRGLSSPASSPLTSRPSPTTPTRAQAGPGWEIGLGRERSRLTCASIVRSRRPAPSPEPRGSGRERIWRKVVQSGQLPADIPAAPNNTCKNAGWVGMGDWLGTGTVAPRLRQYRPFEGGPRLRPLSGAQVAKGVGGVHSVGPAPR